MADDKQWLVLSGRLGKDPEQKTSRKGTNYLSFSVATNCGGETEWWNVLVFGAKVAPISKYFKKGDQIKLIADKMNKNTISLLDFEFPKQQYRPESKPEETTIDVDALISDFPFNDIDEIEV